MGSLKIVSPGGLSVMKCELSNLHGFQVPIQIPFRGKWPPSLSNNEAPHLGQAVTGVKASTNFRKLSVRPYI